MLISRGIWQKVLRWNKRLIAVFLFLPFVLWAQSPYFLETGPEQGSGLPFLSKDLSLYYTGTYINRDTGFRVRVFYTADVPGPEIFSDAAPFPCAGTTEYRVSSGDPGTGFPSETVVYGLFTSRGWDPYFSLEEDPQPQTPKRGVLFFIIASGDRAELCTFIPLFEERLGYYMNVRKQEALLPLPAVIEVP
ncbi:MAG: hypothetical protein JXB03_06555 [Spirochaetales bacterium]|nr:hypothetical protein [Spirochaetales bacterium]